MPFRNPETLLRDMVDAVGMIEQFTGAMDFEAFREDPKTVAAVERKLQIISEAATRLGVVAEDWIHGIQWREIRGIGNWLRHQYEGIELPVIFKTIKDDLPPLKAAVLGALDRGTIPFLTPPPAPKPPPSSPRT